MDRAAEDDDSAAWGACLGLLFWAASGIAYALALRGTHELMPVLPCLFFGHYVAILVHECGHAFVAKRRGWRIVTFTVRPFALHLTNRDLAFFPWRFRRGHAASVLTVPRCAAVDTKANRIRIIAAGPQAGFLLMVMAWLLAIIVPRSATLSILAIGPLAVGLGIQSLHLSVVSLLPWARNGVESDGAKLRALRRPDYDYEKDRALLWLGSLLATNVRLRDVPDWLLERARCQPSSVEALDRHLATFEIGRELDRIPVDPVRARQLIEAFRSEYGNGGWLAACEAYLSTIWEAREPRDEAMIASADYPAPEEMKLAAEAAIAARRGDAAVTKAKLVEMRRALRRASPFRNPTFHDIQSRIERVLAETARSHPAPVAVPAALGG